MCFCCLPSLRLNCTSTCQTVKNRPASDRADNQSNGMAPGVANQVTGPGLLDGQKALSTTLYLNFQNQWSDIHPKQFFSPCKRPRDIKFDMFWTQTSQPLSSWCEQAQDTVTRCSLRKENLWVAKSPCHSWVVKNAICWSCLFSFSAMKQVFCLLSICRKVPIVLLTPKLVQ